MESEFREAVEALVKLREAADEATQANNMQPRSRDALEALGMDRECSGED